MLHQQTVGSLLKIETQQVARGDPPIPSSDDCAVALLTAESVFGYTTGRPPRWVSLGPPQGQRSAAPYGPQLIFPNPTNIT